MIGMERCDYCGGDRRPEDTMCRDCWVNIPQRLKSALTMAKERGPAAIAIAFGAIREAAKLNAAAVTAFRAGVSDGMKRRMEVRR